MAGVSASSVGNALRGAGVSKPTPLRGDPSKPDEMTAEYSRDRRGNLRVAKAVLPEGTADFSARISAVIQGFLMPNGAWAVPLQYLTGAGEKAAPVVALTWGVLVISVIVMVV